MSQLLWCTLTVTLDNPHVVYKCYGALKSMMVLDMLGVMTWLLPPIVCVNEQRTTCCLAVLVTGTFRQAHYMTADRASDYKDSSIAWLHSIA